MKCSIVCLSFSTLIALVFVVAVSVVDARKKPASSAQAPPPPIPNNNEPPPAQLLLDPPVAPLHTIQEFQASVMETVLPVFLFVGNSKKTPYTLRRNVTLAATAVQTHIVPFFMDTVTQAGKDFVKQAGLPANGPGDHIMLFNPEFVRQGDQGGFAKNPAIYTGATTPYGISRWMIAMSSRKHIDYIQDISDLAAWKKKFAGTAISGTSFPKVLLLTSGNFTSPNFVAVSHQFRFLAQFGVVQGITREAYDKAMAEMDKEEQEMKKIKDVGLSDASSSAAAAAASGNKKHTSFSTFFDKADEILLASTFSPTASSSSKKKGSAASIAAEKRDAKHLQLLKVLGAKDVPAIVTLSGDLGDAEVYPAANMTLARLQEIVRDHALPSDQFQQIFGKGLQAEFDLEQQMTKLSRQQKRESAKFKKLAEDDDESSSSSSSRSGAGGKGAASKESELAAFYPVWVNKTADWSQYCELKSTGKKISKSKKSLCVAVFMEDPLNNLFKYNEKVEELQKGIRKIEKQNRHGFEQVRLLIWEVPKKHDMAKFFSIDVNNGIFPAAVFVNPVKGTYYNHIGKFTGSSLAEFAMGRMGSLKAKVYKKESFNYFFPELAEEEGKRKKRKEEWDRKEAARKQRLADRKRKKEEEAEAAAAEEARKNVDEEIVAED